MPHEHSWFGSCLIRTQAATAVPGEVVLEGGPPPSRPAWKAGSQPGRPCGPHRDAVAAAAPSRQESRNRSSPDPPSLLSASVRLHGGATPGAQVQAGPSRYGVEVAGWRRTPPYSSRVSAQGSAPAFTCRWLPLQVAAAAPGQVNQTRLFGRHGWPSEPTGASGEPGASVHASRSAGPDSRPPRGENTRATPPYNGTDLRQADPSRGVAPRYGG
jgi:hypothetical protein